MTPGTSHTAGHLQIKNVRHELQEAHIAVLDDDEAMLGLISRCVRAQGYKCSVFSRVEKFYEALESQLFDLIVLDWMMPQGSGLDVVKVLRSEREVSSPIMMVSSRQLEQDVAFALYKGIDDYVVKPLRPAEFAARIDLLLRRSVVLEERLVLNFGPYVFNESACSVTLNGQAVDLSPKEFDLSLYLFRQLNARLVRQQILMAVFGRTTDQFTRTLDTHVYNIRRSLQLDGRHGFKLMAVYGVGYRLAVAAPQGAAISAAPPPLEA